MNELIQVVLFYTIAFISILGAGAIIFKQNLVHAAISFLFSFLAIAGLYFMLNADFIAIAQIMIYSVGITLIMLFAIMLTNRSANFKLGHKLTLKNAVSALSIIIVLAFLTFGIVVSTAAQNSPEGFSLSPISDLTKITVIKEGTTGIIGKKLFTQFILPFELLSILLLIAMIGAIVLAKKHFTGDLSNPTTKRFDEELLHKYSSTVQCDGNKQHLNNKEEVGVIS